MGFLNLSASDRVDIGAVGAVFLIFAVICFITVINYDSTEEPFLSTSISGKEKILGPIETNKKDTVLAIEFSHRLQVSGYRGAVASFVEGEVLDHDRNYLFSFGKEFWAEAGYDDGYWQESDTQALMKLTLPDIGSYYLRFKTEGSLNQGVRVTVSRLTGSGIPHRILGVIALVVGIVLFWLGARSN